MKISVIKKVGATICATALAGCIAVPAFAAEATTTTQDKNFTTGDGSTTADVTLAATVAKEGTLISVTVPASIPFAVSLDDTNGYFKALNAPIATVKNSEKSNAPIKVSVSAVTEETQGANKFLDQMNSLYLKGSAAGTDKTVDMINFGSLQPDDKALIASLAKGASGSITVGTNTTETDNVKIEEGAYTVKAVLKIESTMA